MKSTKMLFGFGINDCEQKVSKEAEGRRITDKAYYTWYNMIERCYSGKQKAYQTSKVCEEWRRFSNFKEWWEKNEKKGYCLDKDILSDTKEYGPETCIFVPHWLNCFVVPQTGQRGKWPIGVSKKRNKFTAHCNHGKKRIYLGVFNTPEEANNAWLKKKKEMATERKDEMDTIDHRIYPRIMEMIDGLQSKIVEAAA